MKRNRAARGPGRNESSNGTRAGSRDGRGWLLGCLTALITATPIIPSETLLLGGMSLGLILAWLILFVAWALMAVINQPQPFRGGPAIVAWGIFLAWLVISAWMMASQGQPRATINATWQWITLGLTFFLARQLIRTGPERRAIAAWMMALAVCLSAVGYYQYLFEHPVARAAYERDPEGTLREAGILAPPDSPQRRAFENRLYSTEPFATFALANSLAGFLTPWLLVAAGVGILHWRRGESLNRTFFAVAVTSGLIAGCWLLTKSRTAVLSGIVGVLLLACFGCRRGWKPGRRFAVGAIIAATLSIIAVLVVRALDAFVISEAPKALLYRFEYWQATWNLIADYPLFGCGPGNFQPYYTAYKLPQASETVADPHNFLLEIWAAAGTIGFLSFIAILIGIAWQALRGAAQPVTQSSDELASSVRSVYWGGLGGGISAYAGYALFEGYYPSHGLVLCGFPLACLVLAQWHHWVMQGTWSQVVPAVGVMVLLVNLLAAGGISFVGVAQSLWVLAALWLLEAEGDVKPVRTMHRRWGLAAAGAGLLAVAAFAKTAYFPPLQAQAHILEGERFLGGRQPLRALESFQAAAAADPYSPAGVERLAHLAHEAWLATNDPLYRDAFIDAEKRLQELNPRSSSTHAQLGHWWLAAYRRFDEPAHLDRALELYRIAIELYPNYNWGHAQLAWALFLDGQMAAARQEAERSLALDSQNPHREQKLKEQYLFDPGSSDPSQPQAPGERKAEQLMLDLRNRSS